MWLEAVEREVNLPLGNLHDVGQITPSNIVFQTSSITLVIQKERNSY